MSLSRQFRANFGNPICESLAGFSILSACQNNLNDIISRLMFAQRYEFCIFEKNHLFVKPLQLPLILTNSQSILYKAGYNLINTAPENRAFDYI